MTLCIYCQLEKPDGEFSLEHVIPQCLGGAYAPDLFKIKTVCKKCNSNLGLFVDAAFEKNWLVSNWLQQAAFACFDPDNPTALPLVCMGNSDLAPPQINDDEVCESWLGPLGEQVFWIRPKDEELYWYVGGNPRTAKDIESRAYFLFSGRSHKNPLISWLAFRDAFERRRVKKIMCTQVDGANPQDIGFSTPDTLDQQRITFFNATCCQPQVSHKNSITLNLVYDFRFMAKLGLGLGCALFGNKVLESAYAAELRKGLWYREGQPDPQIRGTPALANNSDPLFKKLVGEKHAITLVIVSSRDGIGVNLNIGTEMNWSVMCSTHEKLDESDRKKIGHGMVLVLYKHLQKGFYLSLIDYVAHKLGKAQHPDLEKINNFIARHAGYFKNL